MLAIKTRFICSLIFALLLIPIHAQSQGQPLTEIRDPIRGITFYSKELSVVPAASLKLDKASTIEPGQLALGISAFYYDTSELAGEYLMWLRHDGSTPWFNEAPSEPLLLSIEEINLDLKSMHTTSLAADGEHEYMETATFSLTTLEFLQLLSANSITLNLQSSRANVSKKISAEEHELIADFAESAYEAHEKIRQQN